MRWSQDKLHIHNVARVNNRYFSDAGKGTEAALRTQEIDSVSAGAGMRVSAGMKIAEIDGRFSALFGLGVASCSRGGAIHTPSF